MPTPLLYDVVNNFELTGRVANFGDGYHMAMSGDGQRLLAGAAHTKMELYQWDNTLGARGEWTLVSEISHSGWGDLAISADEFAVLLDDNSINATRRFALTSALAEDELDPARQAQSEGVRGALRLTLQEKTQRELWESNPRVRMRAMLAMLREDDHVACLEHALGEVLKSDHRRIDDLRCATEEEGIDIMSVAQLISTTCTSIGT